MLAQSRPCMANGFVSFRWRRGWDCCLNVVHPLLLSLLGAPLEGSVDGRAIGLLGFWEGVL